MRVVLDANVLVSATISKRGSPGKILDLWEKEKFDLVMSPSILEELERVIHYPKIQEKYHLAEGRVEQFLGLISNQSITVTPFREIDVIEKDPSDNRYLECAKAGNASYIITGDRHFLELKEFEGIVILPPAGFIALLELEAKNKGQ
jgi:putative PIN family toxin of toxin-antitoxin system